jgi:hypothetical protein
VSIVITLGAVHFGCGGPGKDVEDDSATLNVDLNDPRIKERLGEDDGYAFAVMYGSDVHGSLETCG